MKLELNLDEVDFKRQLKLFAKAEDMALCLWEYDQALRNKIKYPEEDMIYEDKRYSKDEIFEEARDLLRQNMEDFCIDLDDLC